ncbi:MAG: redoxin domain-containing protein, partial [Pseudomonadota bacterium]
MLQRVACSLILFAAASLSVPAVADVPERAEDVTPISVGDSAPAFEVQGKDGETFAFDPVSHNGKTMVIFYRGGWCPYCNRHLAALRDVVPTLREAGVDILFLSADKPELLYS